MRKMLMLITFVIFLSQNLFAQQDPNDPGIQDSIIVESVYVDSGVVSAFVHIYAVTDDSVNFYQMLIAWESLDYSVHAGLLSYGGYLLCWDVCYDSVIMSESCIPMHGFADTGGDENCYLNTDGQRMLSWTIRFIIRPDAPPQDVRIDTTNTNRSGTAYFGLADGTGFVPAFVPGYFYYRIPTGINNENPRPGQFYLSQNYPNPFNASTEIIFDLPSAQNVNLAIYNLLGQQVAILVDDYRQSGHYSVNWHGTDMNGNTAPSGLYFYRLSTSDNVQTRKMIMMK